MIPIVQVLERAEGSGSEQQLCAINLPTGQDPDYKVGPGAAVTPAVTKLYTFTSLASCHLLVMVGTVGTDRIEACADLGQSVTWTLKTHFRVNGNIIICILILVLVMHFYMWVLLRSVKSIHPKTKSF